MFQVHELGVSGVDTMGSSQRIQEKELQTFTIGSSRVLCLSNVLTDLRDGFPVNNAAV